MIVIDLIKRRVRNRWLVAYTLLRNQSIQGLTAGNLSVNKSSLNLSIHENQPQLEEVEVHQNSVGTHQNETEKQPLEVVNLES